ncbi:MAG TPA: TIGR03857 family LLM class F420-dependent oxidoreductase [Amycolatopsis sp.]|nr:TIGR03857 family LLM class F420-dependent oxidoreductase [Amycolatopsis sp.]
MTTDSVTTEAAVMPRGLAAGLGSYILPGAAHDPRAGLDEAVAAERMGLGAVWIGERYDTKDLPALASAVGQVTGHVRIGAAVTHPYLRHPMVLASMGQTLQSLTGERFRLGFGRSAMWRWRAYGAPAPTLRSLRDLADILHRLWAGETVAYEGALGTFPRLRLPVVLPLAPPPLLLAAVGPKTLELAGRAFDGVILHPLLTPEAVGRSAKLLRDSAEKSGRDPDAVRCIATVLVAPGVGKADEDEAIRARSAGYLSVAGLGDAIAAANHWSADDLARYRHQQVLVDLDGQPADKQLSRRQLVELCAGMPADWLPSGAVMGDIVSSARRLTEYVDAGADEIILHGVVGAKLGPLMRHIRRAGV